MVLTILPSYRLSITGTTSLVWLFPLPSIGYCPRHRFRIRDQLLPCSNELAGCRPLSATPKARIIMVHRKKKGVNLAEWCRKPPQTVWLGITFFSVLIPRFRIQQVIHYPVVNTNSSGLPAKHTSSPPDGRCCLNQPGPVCQWFVYRQSLSLPRPWSNTWWMVKPFSTLPVLTYFPGVFGPSPSFSSWSSRVPWGFIPGSSPPWLLPGTSPDHWRFYWFIRKFEGW